MGFLSKIFRTSSEKGIENVQAAVKHQAKRTVIVAQWVKKANQ